MAQENALCVRSISQKFFRLLMCMYDISIIYRNIALKNITDKLSPANFY